MTAASRNAVVIVRLRGRTDLGSTLTETLARYVEALQTTNSKLMLITGNKHVIDQLTITGITDAIGDENLYRSDEWLGKTTRRAYDDAQSWIDQ